MFRGVEVGAINVFELGKPEPKETRSVNKFFLHVICFAVQRDVKILR
jgi:hypothetical protein